MKTLTLHCVCGLERTFRGNNMDEILAAIDKSGWHDYPDHDGKYAKGHHPALCPECHEFAREDELID